MCGVGVVFSFLFLFSFFFIFFSGGGGGGGGGRGGEVGRVILVSSIYDLSTPVGEICVFLSYSVRYNVHVILLK